ncbi:MAG: glycerophosphodiester phosphodiesterase family protein [Smithellaceae bacterium]|nr:glycerophosphodiester phosphodiesterase family protein [Smithellaceae bacterium]
MYKPYHLFIYNARDNGGGRAQDVRPAGPLTIIAHRGASAYYPENTIASFKAAIAMGADMVELDVQMTQDGEVVVFHDEEITRCTNGRGRIADHGLVNLKKLDAGSWFDKKFSGAEIPLLSDVLSLCKDRIAVNIEIKTEAVKEAIRGGIEEKCLQIVHQTGIQDHVVFSSFDPRALRHLRHLDRQTPLAVLFEKKYYDAQLPSEIVASRDVNAFNCSRRELNRKWLDDLKQHGIPVNVYTVNDEQSMKRFHALGVEGIFTNKPDILRTIVNDLQKDRKIEAGIKA